MYLTYNILSPFLFKCRFSADLAFLLIVVELLAVDRKSKTILKYNQSKHLELEYQLMFLIYTTILNILIGCVYKIVLDCQPTTIKLKK